MLKILSIFVLSISFLGYYPIHDLHLSKTEIKFKSSQAAIQISMQIFIDDLEDAIQIYGSDNPRLYSGAEIENSDQLIIDYISKSLAIRVDGHPMKFEFIGREQSGDLMAVWCYLEISGIHSYKEIIIENHILHDLFEDQKNIVSFYKEKENTKFVILDKKKTQLKIEN